jgi:hypothetical protein
MTKSTARRSPGEGSIYEVDGRWRGAVSWMEPDGKRRRKVVRGATRREVRDKIVAVRREWGVGSPTTTPGTLTVAEDLTDWIAEVERERREALLRDSRWQFFGLLLVVIGIGLTTAGQMAQGKAASAVMVGPAASAAP